MKPRVNLCTFNHHPWVISDQIWFIREVFAQQGYSFTISDCLERDCLNILVENFVELDVSVIGDFCRRYHKQIGVVMTEHVEFKTHKFKFSGDSLESDNYIGNRKQRLLSLLAMSDDLFALFTLGELPALATLDQALPRAKIYHLPYPSLRVSPALELRDQSFDVIFTGTRTRHRGAVLQQLRKQYRVMDLDVRSSEEERVNAYSRAKVAVNIPQSETWEWTSPMRFLFGIRNNLATVHLGKSDNTAFSEYVVAPFRLPAALQNPLGAFEEQLKGYQTLVASSDNDRFPESLFDLWGLLESVPTT